MNEGREAALAEAEASVSAAIKTADDDGTRPTFHFHSPAQWMNDPNGPIYYDGWYHLFYQYNPYGDQWNHMHWGHARSRDLVRWEHLPIALWPSVEAGEEHVFSGSTFLDHNGKPVIFYTSIGSERRPEQWAATPNDEELLQWSKSATNPILTDEAIDEWRDPYLFTDKGRTYMLVGGGQSGKGVIVLYSATNSELTAWRFERIVLHHEAVTNLECPNIVKIDDRWVMLVSLDGYVEWFSGSFDPASGVFQTLKNGIVAGGSYASQLLFDKDGQPIHLAWVNTSKHKGWNGWITLPSVLGLTPDGELTRKPISTLEGLRGAERVWEDRAIEGEVLLDKEAGDRLEIFADVEVGNATEIRLRVLTTQEIVFEADGSTLSLPGRSPIPIALEDGRLRLRIFVDRSALDVYSEDGLFSECVALDYTPEQKALSVVSAGGEATIRTLRVWKMSSAF